MTTVPFPDEAVRGPKRASLASAWGLLLALGACAPDDDDPQPPSGGLGSAIPVPAASASGEPFLASTETGVWMSWIEPAPSGHRLAASFFDGEWSPVVTVARGDDFFVNWADFPSIRAFGDQLVAHWLQRGDQGGYDYGVRIVWSDDFGATWSEPWVPHDDGTPTEHGFVSIFKTAEGIQVAWLDGRAMVEEDGTMSIRTRGLPISGPAGSETVLDAQTCECCQTDAVVADGTPVVAFRNRAEGEVRDIHVTRRLGSDWTRSVPVYEDGWVIGGCPVNGPALDARGSQVVVAWFTAPDGEARVNVAFSFDGAESFRAPSRVDAGQPSGRVDVVLLDDGSALVTWLERSRQGAAILSRRVSPDGVPGDLRPLAVSSESRASGFPRIARLGSNRLMLGWTDPEAERVRVSVFDLSEWGEVR